MLDVERSAARRTWEPRQSFADAATGALIRSTAQGRGCWSRVNGPTASRETSAGVAVDDMGVSMSPRSLVLIGLGAMALTALACTTEEVGFGPMVGGDDGGGEGGQGGVRPDGAITDAPVRPG